MGTRSHAEGNVTYASGIASHAEGHNTIANHDYQHVSGKWNVPGNYAVIVGNGKDSQSPRSNAYTLDWEGNGIFAGTVSSKDGELATKGYVDSQVGDINATINTLATQNYVNGKVEGINATIETLATKDYVNSQITDNNKNYYTATTIDEKNAVLQVEIERNYDNILVLNDALKDVNEILDNHTTDINSLNGRVAILESGFTQTNWADV
jgi:hypothetical protein